MFSNLFSLPGFIKAAQVLTLIKTGQNHESLAIIDCPEKCQFTTFACIVTYDFQVCHKPESKTTPVSNIVHGQVQNPTTIFRGKGHNTVSK